MPSSHRPVLLALLLSWPVTAFAQESPPGLERIFLGARLGYGLPTGKADADERRDDFNGLVPLTLELGYRLGPRWTLVGSMQYGLGILDGGATASCVSCVGLDLALGASAYLHIAPLGAWKPWVGLGVAYERRTLEGSNEPATFLQVRDVLSGVQFLNLQAGADHPQTSTLSVGPFVAASLGAYLSRTTEVNAENVLTTESGKIPKKSLHAWLTLGVRCRFDLWGPRGSSG